MALVEDTGAGAAADDPEALLNEWLGELTVLTAVSILFIIDLNIQKIINDDILLFNLKIITNTTTFYIY